MVAMVDEAVSTGKNREVTWPIFARELWAWFGPPAGINFNEALKKLQQTRSLVEYQEGRVSKFGESVDWLDAFLGGLQPDLAEA